MSTPAGLLAFHRPDVNAHPRDILTAYGTFLSSPPSAAVLNSSPAGWLGKTALNTIASTAFLLPSTTSIQSESESTRDTSDPRPRTPPLFHDIFISDPNHPTHGFASWDGFFTRRFRSGIRPTASPSDDSVIVNACESTPVALQRGVKLHDEFWVKGQPYGLVNILRGLEHSPWEGGLHSDTHREGSKGENEEDEDEDEELREALRFEGGTIYQGFLEALSYHRWHAPVAGTVEKVRKIRGTCFAGCPGLASSSCRDATWEEQKLDPSAPDRSQRYLCQVGTRALVYIRARDRRFGTVVFVAVGMAEVSSCEVTVREGDVLDKGDEIGMVSLAKSFLCCCGNVECPRCHRERFTNAACPCMMQFHDGGSTHCLIFEPGVRLKFTEAAEKVDDVMRQC